MLVAVRAHLVEQAGNKAGQDLAVAENQYPGDGGIGGKYLALVLPSQLGAEYYVGAILQIGELAPEAIQRGPGYGEKQNRPAESRRDGSLLFLCGFGVGGGLDVQNSPWTFIVLQPLKQNQNKRTRLTTERLDFS